MSHARLIQTVEPRGERDGGAEWQQHHVQAEIGAVPKSRQSISKEAHYGFSRLVGTTGTECVSSASDAIYTGGLADVPSSYRTAIASAVLPMKR